MKNQNLYFTLEAQLNKLARHNRQGSYRTKERYYMAMKRFCHFLAENYHLQKLSNISGKHLVAYVLWMQEKGLSASTIKTDLAAIPSTYCLPMQNWERNWNGADLVIQTVPGVLQSLIGCLGMH